MRTGQRGAGRPWGCQRGRTSLSPGLGGGCSAGGGLLSATLTPHPSSPEDPCGRTSHHGQLCPKPFAFLPPLLAATLPTFCQATSPAALLQAQHTRHHPHGSLIKTHKEGEKALTSSLLLSSLTFQATLPHLLTPPGPLSPLTLPRLKPQARVIRIYLLQLLN